MKRLRGRRALVTGASSGLGVDFARQLGAAGCNLVLVARRQDRLSEVRDEVKDAHGVEVDVIPADLSAAGARQELFARLEGKDVDVLVNNAGYGIYGAFADVEWERTGNMLQLDVVALVHLTRLFLPGMVERGFGRVLQVSSIAAYQPSPTYAAYGAAKGFVLSFGEALNYELKGTGVCCTVLSPGNTATAFHQVAGQDLTLYQRLTMMPSPKVARIGLRAMMRGRSSVMPGLFNRLLAWSSRFVPRRLAAAITNVLMHYG